MKITMAAKAVDKVKFETLSPGQVFCYNGDYYLKVNKNPSVECPVEVISFKNMTLYSFGSVALVEPVDSELIIYNKG
jgi:hypothetical protein